MRKDIDINMYIDGYNVEKLNCVDLPFAALAGSINYDYYFYYSFYYSLLMNWADDKKESANYRENILEILGLEIEKYEFSHKENFLSYIKTSIDDNKAILVLVNYNKTFYYSNYKNAVGQHGIIVSGYDEENETVTIRDFKIVDSGVHPEIKMCFDSDPFYRFNITYNMLFDMCMNDKSEFTPIYRLIRKKEVIVDPKYALKKLVDRITTCNSSIGNYIISPDLLDLELFPHYRRIYFHAIKIIFDFIERFFGINLDKSPDEIRDEYEGYLIGKDLQSEIKAFKDEYVKRRSLAMSILQRDALKQFKNYYEKRQGKLYRDVIEMDERLLKIVSEILYNCVPYNEEKDWVNYAHNAYCIADSGLLLPNSKISDGANATNGNGLNWMTDMWHSAVRNEDHWLQVKVENCPTVQKFAVKHFGQDLFNTKAYVIQGSYDGETWVDLVSVTDNTKDKTIHHIAPVQFDFYRLYITDPCEAGDAARIFEFEIWGPK